MANDLKIVTQLFSVTNKEKCEGTNGKYCILRACTAKIDPIRPNLRTTISYEIAGN